MDLNKKVVIFRFFYSNSHHFLIQIELYVKNTIDTGVTLGKQSARHVLQKNVFPSLNVSCSTFTANGKYAVKSHR